MKLLFQEQTIEIEPSSDIESVIWEINGLLGKDYYYSHLVIDGVEVTESPEQYLTTKLQKIHEIEVVAIEAKKFINDMLLSAEEYVQKAGPILEVLAEKFYETPTGEEYSDLNDLFGGLQWLHSMIDVIEISKVRPEQWGDINETVEPLQEILSDFEEALENSDTVLIADLLSYEIKPVFEALSEQLTSIIDREGERYELH